MHVHIVLQSVIRIVYKFPQAVAYKGPLPAVNEIYGILINVVRIFRV
jgi:hypothetical protein